MKRPSSTDAAADEVRLSDGRVARVRAADPAADRRADLFALQARLFKGGRIDPIVGASVRAVLAIQEIDGAPVAWPPCSPTPAGWRAYLARFTLEDINALARAYNAATPGAMTQLFRPGRRGAPRGRMLGGQEG